MFTGVVIFVWGFRAIRNGRVKVLFFQMRNQWSTMIFGITSALCGLLMALTGAAAAASYLDADSVEILAKSGLYMFGAAWIFALILEALARVGWRFFPDHAPQHTLETGIASRHTGQKRKNSARAGAIGFWRGRFQAAINMLLSSGSRVYHRVMLPPRSWDRQNLWHGDGEYEKLYRAESEKRAELDNEAFIRETRRGDGALNSPNADESR